MNNTKNPIDDFLRSNLDEYQVEPSSGSWKGIKRKLLWNEIVMFRFLYYRYRWIWFSAALTASLLLGYLFYPVQENETIVAEQHIANSEKKVNKGKNLPLRDSLVTYNTKTRENQESEEHQQGYSDESGTADPFHDILNTNTDSKESSIVVKTDLDSHEEDDLNQKQVEHVGKSMFKEFSEEPAQSEVDDHEMEIYEKSPGEIITSNEPESDPAQMQFSNTFFRYDILRLPRLPFYRRFPDFEGGMRRSFNGDQLRNFEKKSIKPFDRSAIPVSNWYTGFYVGYERMFNYSEFLTDRSQYSLEIALGYQSSGYLLETGLSVMRNKSDKNYFVDYEQYLGTYQDLDSISFFVDPSTNDLIPTYYWIETDVFDSVSLTAFGAAPVQYTYLKVPFFTGYQIHAGKFILQLKGGMIFNMMLGDNEKSLQMDLGRDRIKTTVSSTPERVKTYWQIAGNISLQYRLSGSLLLSLEPGMKYCLDPVYQEESAKLPYSAGVRFGIVYEFSRKTIFLK